MKPKLRLHTGPNFKNIKTGKIYRVVSFNARNCTNANDGQEMIVYTENETGNIYTREKTEFLEKFEFVDALDLEKLKREFLADAIKCL